MKNNKAKPTPRFNKEICLACAICVDVCPAGALDLIMANSISGFRRFPFLAAANTCIGCFSCERHCPSGAITMTE